MAGLCRRHAQVVLVQVLLQVNGKGRWPAGVWPSPLPPGVSCTAAAVTTALMVTGD